MRIRMLIMLACLAPWVARTETTDNAGLTQAEAEQQFFAAGAAYKDKEYARAAADYKSLLDAGFVSVETLFNYGNACFKQGDVDDAVLAYRRAWYLAPRDPDLAANLRFALQTSGGIEPERSTLFRIFTEFSWLEWRAATSVALWILFITAGLWLVFRRVHAWLGNVMMIAMVLVLLTASGWGYWALLLRSPEGVMTGGEVTARFAPMADATPAFSLPAGSIITILEENKDWYRVGTGDDTGWVPKTNCKQVYPWKPGAS